MSRYLINIDTARNCGVFVLFKIDCSLDIFMAAKSMIKELKQVCLNIRL